jgi:predicted TIM-barrel fold metal-dependent hydrolase
MQKIIDLCLDLPQGEEQIIDELKTYTLRRGEKGVSNYRNIFGPEKAGNVGLTLEDLDKMADRMSPEEFDHELRQRARKITTTIPDFIKEMDENGVRWGMTRVNTNEETAAVVKQYPQRFMGIAIANPHKGMKAVRDLEEAVKELGLKAFFASPYHYGLKLNDKKFYPLYAKAAELNIPVFCYSTMTYRNDFPMDIAHPLCLDEVAMDFPELTIIAGWGGGGGWPWVSEMVGVARRHQNVYINFSAHRPKYLGTPGSGWEMLIQFGNTLLQDRVVYASGWSNYFSYSKGVIRKVIDEVMGLPLKDAVKEKWLYKNAARLFQRE